VVRAECFSFEESDGAPLDSMIQYSCVGLSEETQRRIWGKCSIASHAFPSAIAELLAWLSEQVHRYNAMGDFKWEASPEPDVFSDVSDFIESDAEKGITAKREKLQEERDEKRQKAVERRAADKESTEEGPLPARWGSLPGRPPKHPDSEPSARRAPNRIPRADVGGLHSCLLFFENPLCLMNL
jgi:hypothetical protein